MTKDHTDFYGRRIFYLRHEHLVHQAFRIKICCHKRPYIGPSAKHNDGVRRRNRIRHDPKIGRTLQQRCPLEPRDGPHCCQQQYDDEIADQPVACPARLRRSGSLLAMNGGRANCGTSCGYKPSSGCI